MKPRYLLQTIIAIFFLLHSICTPAQQGKSLLPKPAIYQQKMQLPALLFMENKGQVADAKNNARPDILFTANSGVAKIYITANSIHYQFSKIEYPKGYDPFSRELPKNPQQEEALRKQIKTSMHHFTVELQGANLHPTISKQGQSSYYENYYLTQCPNGITNVHGFAKMVYQNVYPQIDWVIYSKGGFMKYDFLVHPGGNPASIKLKIKDADQVSITPHGELLMKTHLGEVKEKAPVSYADGHLVSSRFKQNSDGTIGFAVQPQPGKELRIDPSVVWSTYYGGSNDEVGSECTTDGSGNVYLSGKTSSFNNIYSGGFQSGLNGGTYDAFLTKFNNNGNRIWATYYGGNGNDESNGCNTDATGNVFMTGETGSTTVIASGGFQNTYGGGVSDLFAVKFTSGGARVWSTYCGGSTVEYARKSHMDAAGNLYLTGNTYSTNNIALNGFQMVYGGGFQGDAFIEKISNNGTRLWGTYYGGSDSDIGNDCCTDANGNVYFTGSTRSLNGISFSGFQNTIGSNYTYDAFLVKFDASGNRIWATYYGGTEADYAYTCATDANGDVYIAGEANSANNIAYNGFQMALGGTGSTYGDAFVAKFSPNGSRIWATYYGGSSIDYARKCAIDASGNIVITGATESTNNIANNGFQNSYTSGRDAFITKISSTGILLWASYYGGTGYDDGLSCTTDLNNNLFFCGYTDSNSGIAYNGFQNISGGFYDAFIVKVTDNICVNATQPVIGTTADSICTGSSLSLSIASGTLNSATTWQWRKDSCNGAMVGTGTSIMVSPTATTTYFVRGEGGCAAPGNCASKTIVVNAPVTPTILLTATPAGTITAGTPVTFIATPTNFGTSPSFVFKVNGIIVQSGTNNYYVSNTLNNGDVVTVTLNSNAPCATPSSVMSNAITIVIAVPCISPTTPTIATNYDTVCSGATPTLIITSGNLNSATHWQWYTDSCGGTPVGSASSITVTPNATTTYYVRGEGGCAAPGNCASKTIYIKPKPIVSFTVSPATVCPGDTSIVTFTGMAPANAVYTWNWANGSVISGTEAGPYQVVYNAAGSVNLTVSNGTCSVAATTQAINPVPAPELSFTVSDTAGCGPLAVTLSANPLNVSGWAWNFGDGIIVNNNSPVQHTYSAGSYHASLTVHRGACTTTASTTIRVYKKPTAAFTALPGINTPVSSGGAQFVFTNTSQDASRYVWQFGDTGNSTVASPNHRYNAAGIYAVKLYAYNVADCVDSFELKPFIIVADTLKAFYIPNVFSPNNDGINDTWIIPGLQGNTNCKVTIYNRWGQSIFSGMGYSKPWDGNYNSKPLPVDTYYYIITVNDKNYTGPVTLLR